MKHDALKQIKQKFLVPKLMISLLMTVLFYLIYATGFFNYSNWTMQDTFFQHEKTVSENIVVIGVTSHDLQEYGMWPWDRTTWANVLSNINSQDDLKPAAIGLTIPLYGSSQPIPDKLLAEEIAKDNVILACNAEFKLDFSATSDNYSDSQLIKVADITYPYLYPDDNIHLAHTNILFDEDGILRHSLLEITTPQGGIIGSMSYEAYKMYTEFHNIDAEFTPYVDENNFWYVDYSATPGGYFDYSVGDILTHNYEQEDLAGKIVLIGVYDPTLMDYYRPSISSSENMYGIEFIANCTNAMINDAEIRTVNKSTEIICLLIGTFFITFLSLYLKLIVVSILNVLICILGISAIQFAYSYGILYPPFFFLIGLISCYLLSIGFNYWLISYNKKHVTEVFKQYVDPKVVEKLINSDINKANSNGVTSNIAVLFVDLRGFTSLSEKLPASDVVKILNEFLSLTEDCIRKYDGTLDKFIGDCAMAFWGAPNAVEDPIHRACCSAVEMIRRSTELTDAIYKKYNKKISFGVGVHYGPAVVGNVGSATRLDYTAIGDTVNTAARLESAAPANTVYISEIIVENINEYAIVEKLEDKLKLKGKEAPIDIYILKDIKEKQ